MLQMMAELDGRILLFIQEFLRFEWLNPIVLFLTSLGNAGVIWIVLAVLFLIQKKYQKTGIAMTIALLLGLLVTNILLKNWVCRPRPYVAIPQLNALVTAADWSFPSGNSTSSMDILPDAQKNRYSCDNFGSVDLSVQTVCGSSLSVGCGLRRFDWRSGCIVRP